MNPSVPAAPNRPCVVDDRPGGEFAATTAYRAGLRNANPVASMRISGTARTGSDRNVYRMPGDRRQERPEDDERHRAAPVDDPAGERRQDQDRQPEHREGQPDERQVRPEPFEEQAPDDLVRAAAVVPAEIDDERGDQPAVEQPHRPGRAAPATSAARSAASRPSMNGESGGRVVTSGDRVGWTWRS